MSVVVPLRVTVEIELRGGQAAGERRYRLSRQLALQPRARLRFSRPLPVHGEAPGTVCFDLPLAASEAGDDVDGAPGARIVAGTESRRISTAARLVCDPERPELGSEAELVALSAGDQEALERYFEQRGPS